MGETDIFKVFQPEILHLVFIIIIQKVLWLQIGEQKQILKNWV